MFLKKLCSTVRVFVFAVVLKMEGEGGLGMFSHQMNLCSSKCVDVQPEYP